MRYIYLLQIFILIGLSACSKVTDVAEPDFGVTVSSTTVQAGDSVVFNITGNADIISFYSGEIGSDYAFRNKDLILSTKGVQLSFQSSVRKQGATTTQCQDNQFHVMVSSDLVLSGTTMADSVASVQRATWTEITSDFALSPMECSSTTGYFPSGKKDILSFFKGDQPLHIGLWYINRPSTPVNGTSNIWRVSSLLLEGTTDLGTSTLFEQRSLLWSPVFVGDGWNRALYSNAGGILTLRGAITNMAEQQLWVVSGPIRVTDTNLGVALGVGLKALADPALEQFGYRFENPGTYTVTFVGANASVLGRKEKVQQIQLTVLP